MQKNKGKDEEHYEQKRENENERVWSYFPSTPNLKIVFFPYAP